MNDCKILAKRMRYLVPFKFSSDTKALSNRDVISRLDGQEDEFGGKWIKSCVRQGEQDVYDYILDSFDESGYSVESNIGAFFSYPNKSVLPHITYHQKDGKTSKEKSFELEICDVGLFLFGTGIGLLWYEIREENSENGGMNCSEITVFNFHFKELNFAKNRSIFTSDNIDGFVTGDWITRILKPIGSEISYYASRENINMKSDSIFVPDKAILFNYFVFRESDDRDKDSDDRMEMSYYLSKGYKESYRIPAEISDKIFSPFDNVSIFVSKEGAGYYVTGREDEKFYSGDKGLYEKIMNDWFLIYVLVLQQSYSLLKFAADIGRNLTANPEQYLAAEYYDGNESTKEMNRKFYELERKVREQMTQINVFLTKNVRASVSHIQHQNDFYNYAKDQLNIENDTKDMTLGLESLQDLLRDSRQQREASEEGARDERINLTLGLFSIVAFVSAVYDCESLIKDFFMSNDGVSTGSSLMWHIFPYGIIFIILVAAWLMLVIRLWHNITFKTGIDTDKHANLFSRLFHKGRDAEIERLKRENEEIKKAASIDPLTGAYNRVGLEMFSATMLMEAKKWRKNLYVCSIDLNGLKHINDTYGHTYGDIAIKKAAEILKNSVPETAKVFRTGGDEFQIIGVFERETNAVNEIKDKIDKGIAEYNKTVSKEHNIGVSYGWRMKVPDRRQTDINDMFKEADKLMYNMKVKNDPH